MVFEKGYTPWNKDKKTGPRSEELKRKQSIIMMGNQNAKGNQGPKGKHWKLSEKTKKNMSKSKSGLSRPEYVKEKIRKTLIGRKCPKSQKYILEHPEFIERSIKNAFGKKCYYDNEFFPSLQERDCYIKLKKLGLKVKHNFEGRFDFLVNDKIVLEYHPCNWFFEKRNYKQYYRDRRKLLDEYGYKNLKLIVVESLKQLNNLEI